MEAMECVHLLEYEHFPSLDAFGDYSMTIMWLTSKVRLVFCDGLWS
jgi:hypothetical protein